MATRSLGSLTIDLIAKTQGFVQGWTQAERQADRAQKKIAADAKKNAKESEDAWRASAEKVGSAWTAVLGVIGGAVTVSAITNTAKETANLAVEFDKLATLSGLTNQAFQRYAIGAETVGISSEKLADIFKDMQDKAGDFAQTGGGGMADFFEKIAPKVGVTIEQFRRLSGPEALQLYVSSLEKAKLSHQDMIFYMEAVANDSSLLLPLLQNNGKEWERLGKAAEDAGAIMGDRALQAARDYKTESENLERALKGIRIEVMEQVLPAMTQFTHMLSSEATRSSFASIIGWMGQTAAAATSMATTIAQSSFWGWLQIGADDSKDLGKSITETETKIANLQNTVASMSRPLHRLFNADDIAIANGQINTLQSKLKALYAARNQQEAREAAGRKSLGLDLGLGAIETLAYPPASPALSPVTKKPSGGGGKTQSEKDAEAAERYLAALRETAAARNSLNNFEKLALDVEMSKVVLTDKQLEQAKALAIEADDRTYREKQVNEELAYRTSLYDEARSLAEAVLTPTEKWVKQVERLNELSAAGVLDQETYARTVKKYYKDLTDETDSFALNFQKNVQDMIGNTLVQGLSGSFKDIAASFLKMLLQMEAQAAAANFMRLLTGEGEVKSSFLGSLVSKAGSWISSLIPGRATGGPVAGGSLYRVNELGPELLSYGGSDYLMMGGSGGYVKPLGAATTEQRSGAGNVTIVNQTTGRIDKVEQRQLTREEVVLIIQEQTPGIMVNQTQNANSPFSRTMQSSFNTSRRR